MVNQISSSLAQYPHIFIFQASSIKLNQSGRIRHCSISHIFIYYTLSIRRYWAYILKHDSNGYVCAILFSRSSIKQKKKASKTEKRKMVYNCQKVLQIQENSSLLILSSVIFHFLLVFCHLLVPRHILLNPPYAYLSTKIFFNDNKNKIIKQKNSKLN